MSTPRRFTIYRIDGVTYVHGFDLEIFNERLVSVVEYTEYKKLEDMNRTLAECNERQSARLRQGSFLAETSSDVAERKLNQLRRDYESACQTIAKMHEAAVGEVTGPKRGVIEDVEDLRLLSEKQKEQIDLLTSVRESQASMIAKLRSERLDAIASFERETKRKVQVLNDCKRLHKTLYECSVLLDRLFKEFGDDKLRYVRLAQIRKLRDKAKEELKAPRCDQQPATPLADE